MTFQTTQFFLVVGQSVPWAEVENPWWFEKPAGLEMADFSFVFDDKV